EQWEGQGCGGRWRRRGRRLRGDDEGRRQDPGAARQRASQRQGSAAGTRPQPARHAHRVRHPVRLARAVCRRGAARRPGRNQRKGRREEELSPRLSDRFLKQEQAMKMDKDTLMKHRFWVVLAIAAPLALGAIFFLLVIVGGGIASQRKDLQNNIEKLPNPQDAKNQDNVDVKKKDAEKVIGKKDAAWEKAWKEQERHFTWPRK